EEMGLGLLSVKSPEFWEGLAPLPLAPVAPWSGEVRIFRPDSGNLLESSAAIATLEIGGLGRGGPGVLMLKLTTSAESPGEGEVLIQSGQVVGMGTFRQRETLWMVSSPVLLQFSRDQPGTSYRGFASAGFAFQPVTNPALRSYLGL